MSGKAVGGTHGPPIHPMPADQGAGASALAEVTRGALVESVHRGAVIAVDTDGHVVAWSGDVDRVVYFRSSAKPFQAVPLVASGAADAYGFTEEELALACSSHDATPAHQRGVARMLAKIGLDEDALRCGISPPADEQEAARITLGLKAPSPIQCECSGEHAGMLAACAHMGYPLETYVAREHPLQRRILEIVATVLGMDEGEVVIGTDGCSIPTFAAPLRRMAAAYAAFGAPQRSAFADERDPAIDRLRAAMLDHPALVGNDGVLDTDIMRFSGGRIVAKLGAEGLLCMAVPERGWGIAIAAEDGMPRGLGPAAIATLEQLGVADDALVAALRGRHAGPVLSFAGVPVGAVRPLLALSVA